MYFVVSQEAINLGEGTKHSQFVMFYARVLRSGSPQGLYGRNILDELRSNVADMRHHSNALEPYPMGELMKSTMITVRDFAPNRAIITRQLSVWDTFQELISAALDLTAESAVQDPPPREW